MLKPGTEQSRKTVHHDWCASAYKLTQVDEANSLRRARQLPLEELEQFSPVRSQ